MTSQALNRPVDVLREQFEAWMSEDGAYPQAVERNSFGEYRLMSAYTNWGTWQAAIHSPVVVELIEKAAKVASHTLPPLTDENASLQHDILGLRAALDAIDSIGSQP